MKKRKVKSIKASLMLPLTVILCLQMMIFILFYRYGGIKDTLRDNAVQMFSETARHSQLSIERELMTYWTNSIRETDDITEMVEEVLRKNRCSAEAIAVNPELNKEIISAITERLIDVLHHSLGNGVYVVLNGPASKNGDPQEKAGIFIRDFDASSYQQDNSDLLLERGLPSIARQHGIPLDSYWELGVNLDTLENTDFYDKPFDSAVSQKAKRRNATACAYFGPIALRKEEEVGSLGYSMPLILSDGTVIGILGGEISSDRIKQFLEDDVEKNDHDIINLFVRNNGKENSFTTVIAGSNKYEQYFGSVTEFTYEPTQWETVGKVKDIEGDTWYCAIQPLKIYDSYTPFEDEEWLIVHLKWEKNLFASLKSVDKGLMVSVVLSLVIGLGLLVVESHILTNPIKKLMKEIQELDVNRQTKLKKVYIREIDELIDAVNHLSTRVAEHMLKIACILDDLDMDIGIFEYEPNSNTVFCSYSFAKLLGIPCEKEKYQYVKATIFQKKMERLRNPVEDENGRVYEFQVGNEVRYLRLKTMETGRKETTGILIDVTLEIRERKRLEQERDNDPLTGLYNRSAFERVVKSLLNSGEITPCAFVMWDMDNLKRVNDTYGHEEGDRYIRMFADYLRSLEKEGAVVVRRSGDEFMAMLYNGSKEEQWNRIVDFMSHMSDNTMEVPDGGVISLSASAGVAWYPEQGTEFEDLIRYADLAMYTSKKSQKGTIREFSPMSLDLVE